MASPKISAVTLERLAKLLPRLASEHDGEVVNTARAIARTLATAGADFHDLSDLIRNESASVSWSDFGHSSTPGATAETQQGPTPSRPDPMASDASSVRWGLPVWGGATIEPWCVVAQHCLSLDWMIPKASGGRFLSKTERAALKAFATFESPYPTNAEAEWMEAIVTRCHQARDAWRDASEKDAA